MSASAASAPDRKSTRLNSSHLGISYAVFCLKKNHHRPKWLKQRHRQLRLDEARPHAPGLAIPCFFFLIIRRPPRPTLFPSTTLFRSESTAGAGGGQRFKAQVRQQPRRTGIPRSEEHTSELQSLRHLVCRLLLEKK